jgi:hypothetical protein
METSSAPYGHALRPLKGGRGMSCIPISPPVTGTGGKTLIALVLRSGRPSKAVVNVLPLLCKEGGRGDRKNPNLSD